MRLQQLRVRLTLLFTVVLIAMAIGPLLLWRSGRVDAVNDAFDDDLVEQMEIVQSNWIGGLQEDPGFPAWTVNHVDEWWDPIGETDLEPPLITWTQDVETFSDFRNYSQDEESFRGYITPVSEFQSFVTLGDTAERDAELSSLDRRSLLVGLGLVVTAAALGWIGAGLALGPTRRLLDGQQGFLADAAHEMRTPLAVITASSSQALNRERTSEEYVRSLSEIRSAAERASTGVNELLDLVRFDSGQAIPRLAPLRLDLLAEEVAASVRPDECEVVAEPAAPVVVNADMALVRQAIDNVVRNAVRRSTRVELTSHVNGRFGVVEVADDGPGFDPYRLESVFDRYERGDRRAQKGIGLAIVKAIAEANGGDVAASNGADGGAVLTLRFPLAPR
ncbi:MAG: sensor histidine kinase [Ilumatobacter sp.]